MTNHPNEDRICDVVQDLLPSIWKGTAPGQQGAGGGTSEDFVPTAGRSTT